MLFVETRLSGAYLVKPEPIEDLRGSFARTFCREEAAAHGLETTIAQCSYSVNRLAGTLRGLHYQKEPHAEVKWVRCVRGEIYDVLVDLRPGSATYAQWIGTELSQTNGCSLYVPAGFAHGFQTLRDDTELVYQMSSPYVPDAARGARWNDPAFSIQWPIPNPILSERDRDWPDFELDV